MGSSVARVDILAEADPSVHEERDVKFLRLFINAGELVGVLTDCLEVSEVEVPGHVGDDEVHCHSRRIPEALVIRAERDHNSLGQESSSRMGAHVVHIAEGFVAHWADLQADVVLDDLLNQGRRFDNGESVADTFATKQDCVIELIVAAGNTLSGV